MCPHANMPPQAYVSHAALAGPSSHCPGPDPTDELSPAPQLQLTCFVLPLPSSCPPTHPPIYVLQPDPCRKAPLPGPSRPSVRLADAVGDTKPQPVDSWV